MVVQSDVDVHAQLCTMEGPFHLCANNGGYQSNLIGGVNVDLL